MDKTKCWKCAEALADGGCPVCDVSRVELIKESIERAKKLNDSMDSHLSSFREKINLARDRSDIKDIGFAINTLCNIIDLLEEGNSHLISDDELNEVQEKSQQIIKCVETLRVFKQASDERTSQ